MLSVNSEKRHWWNEKWERALWLVYPSASASDSNNLVFTRSYLRRSHKQSRKQMEGVLIFLTSIPSCLSWLSCHDSDFWFSISHKRSYNSAPDSDSVASENQPLRRRKNPLRRPVKYKIPSPATQTTRLWYWHLFITDSLLCPWGKKTPIFSLNSTRLIRTAC